MPPHSTASGYDTRALSSAEISDRLKELLETRHLYQGILVDFEPIIKGIDDIGLSMRRITELEAATRVVKIPWIPTTTRTQAPTTSNTPQKTDGPLEFLCPDIKVYCERCQRVEAYNLRSVQEIFTQSMVSLPGSNKPEQTVQVFTLSYICQSCKSVPEVFLVRREGPTLILMGRSPMEAIDVPSFIPSSVRKFYADALVASHSGQVLSANTLLLHLIEQWIRKCVGGGAKDFEESLATYIGSLPATFEDQFPTLKDTYAELAKDVANAAGSSNVFGIAIEEIQVHFDARRLLKLPL
jgi:hypothetical protein